MKRRKQSTVIHSLDSGVVTTSVDLVTFWDAGNGWKSSKTCLLSVLAVYLSGKFLHTDPYEHCSGYRAFQNCTLPEGCR